MTVDETVVTFFTTHAALRAEKVLKEAGMAVRAIPAPRALSADCTIAVAFPAEGTSRARSILDASGIETSEFHGLTAGG